ncbi:MAG: ABC transporter permease [Paenibacillaceae bacterium ZCTH02-B3]|nr:MAG: ABC transporter permease [Paenibacillaceae bacterium ZCTH02-B3]
MAAYIARRLVIMVISLLGASVVAFFMLYLTGDPTNLLLPDDVLPEEREAFRKQMGFDRPLIVQYGDFLLGLLRGDFGYSFRYQQPALEVVLERVPATAEMMIAAIILMLIIAVPIAVLSVMYNNKWVKSAYIAVTFLGQAIPGFVLAILLILLFSVQLHWLPASGNDQGIKSLIMPSIVLALFGAPQIIRLLRTSLASVMNLDFVRTAKAKGQTRAKIMFFHVFRNALIPFITIVGMQMGILLGGSVITETVFGWPGLGQAMVQAIDNRDYPVVQAGILLSAFFIMAINLIVDVLYAVIDPRIRY